MLIGEAFPFVTALHYFDTKKNRMDFNNSKVGTEVKAEPWGEYDCAMKGEQIVGSEWYLPAVQTDNFCSTDGINREKSEQEAGLPSQKSTEKKPVVIAILSGLTLTVWCLYKSDLQIKGTQCKVWSIPGLTIKQNKYIVCLGPG